jgi:hypothetical protein
MFNIENHFDKRRVVPDAIKFIASGDFLENLTKILSGFLDELCVKLFLLRQQ